MKTLIIKLGATGDVVRTTPLLSRLPGQITWLTEARNTSLLEGLKRDVRCVAWEERTQIPDTKYDLVINLEDSLEAAVYLRTQEYSQLFGAFADPDGKLRYTDDS